jgi:hypothetical protein
VFYCCLHEPQFGINKVQVLILLSRESSTCFVFTLIQAGGRLMPRFEFPFSFNEDVSNQTIGNLELDEPLPCNQEESGFYRPGRISLTTTRLSWFFTTIRPQPNSSICENAFRIRISLGSLASTRTSLMRRRR